MKTLGHARQLHEFVKRLLVALSCYFGVGAADGEAGDGVDAGAVAGAVAGAPVASCETCCTLAASFALASANCCSSTAGCT